MTKEPNEHITKYLKWYISDECKNPRFAVLLKGGWGSGKTWFIGEFIKASDKESAKEKSFDSNSITDWWSLYKVRLVRKIKGDNDKDSAKGGLFDSNFIYLSLYGLDTIDDIRDLIFQELHPVMNHKGIKLGGQLAKSLLSNKLVGFVKIPKINLQDHLTNFGDRVIVFDDLERCNIPVEKVFGYINSFVEHESKKVVVIANDEEIESGLDKNKKKQDSKYHQIKEKVIGKTFKVDTDIPTVIESLVIKVAQSSKTTLLEKKDLLMEIFDLVKDKTPKNYKNYRAFSHVIRDFEYLWKKLDSKYTRHNELITEFLDIFMRLSYELQLGLIKEKDIKSIEAASTARMLSNMANRNKTEKEERVKGYEAIYAFFDRHPMITDNMLLTHELWTQILCETNIDIDKIHESLGNSIYFEAEERPEWLSLWFYRDLEDEHAEKVISLIVKELNAHSYDNIGEIFHIYGALLSRNKEGVNLPDELGNTPEEIEKHAKEYIDYLYAKDKLPKREDIAKQYLDGSYERFGYSSNELVS